VSLTRRGLLLGTGAVLGAVGTRWIGSGGPSIDGLGMIQPAGGEGVLNDASLLSETPVFRHRIVTEQGDALVAVLRAEMAEARAAGRAFNIGAARHSMGGHAIPKDGHAVTFDAPAVEIDSAAMTYRVQAGTRWHQVIAALEPAGLSPKVMQSNADFGVASTYSVNAHGWPTAFGPMGSTVREVQMLLADGSLITASRSENPQIFAAAMGGYGLIGQITSLVVEAERNMALTPTFQMMPAEDFAGAFAQVVRSVPMAYGRLSIDRAGFFDQAMMISYAPVDEPIPPVTGSGFMSKVARPIFRGQVGNEWVKRRRWWLETGPNVWLAGTASRSGLMGEPVVTLDDHDPARTDILHEYFVPPSAFGGFLQACRDIIPQSYQELLNVTLRWVEADTTSLLSYAPDGARIAAVMLFSQEMSRRAEADMAQMTEALIDAVIGLGGTYYLPYRPHARVDQVVAGYAQAPAFAALKRQLDPDLLFRNAFWDKYVSKI
jgi:FAD/FMN-containing dehydrogenase